MVKVNKRTLISLVLIVTIFLLLFVVLFIQKDNFQQATVTGTVTSKFTDCAGGETIDQNGKVVPITNVTCDGGSTITINKKHIFVTTTGMVASGAYARDVSSIKVGDTVQVRYVRGAGLYKSLGCDGCGVTKQ